MKVALLAGSPQQHRVLFPLYKGLRHSCDVRYFLTKSASSLLVPDVKLRDAAVRNWLKVKGEAISVVPSATVGLEAMRRLQADGWAVVLGSAGLPTRLDNPLVRWPHGLLSRSAATPAQEWMSSPQPIGLTGCLGPRSAQALVERGWPRERLFTSGFTTAAIAREIAGRRTTVCAPDRDLLLLCQQAPEGTQRWLLHAAARAARAGFRVTVRRHPAATGPTDLPAGLSLSDPRSEDSLDAITGHRVVLAHWSTGLVEAAALRRACLVAVPDRAEHLLGQDVPAVRTVPDLLAALSVPEPHVDAGPSLLRYYDRPFHVHDYVRMLIHCLEHVS